MARGVSAPVLAAGLVLALTLTSCGGGSTDQDLASRRALGAQALLRHSDLPPGWAAAPKEPQRRQPGLSAEVAACLHVPASSLRDSPAEVRSPAFGDSAGTRVSNNVSVEPSTASAESGFRAFNLPRTPGCVGTAITKILQNVLNHPRSGEALPAGLTFGAAAVSRLSVPSPPAQGSVAYRIRAPLTAGPIHVEVIFDVVVLRVGRADAAVEFGGVGHPVAPSTEQRLVKLTAQRLDAALSAAKP